MDAGAFELGDRLDDLARVVAAGAGEDHRAAFDFVGDDLDDLAAFLGRERRRLAGRAARHDEVDARFDLARRKPPDRRLIDGAVLREGSDERGADAGE